MHRDCWEHAIQGAQLATICPVCVPPPESGARAYGTVPEPCKCIISTDFRGGYIVYGTRGFGAPVLPSDEECARSPLEEIDYVPLEMEGVTWRKVVLATCLLVVGLLTVFVFGGIMVVIIVNGNT